MHGRYGVLVFASGDRVIPVVIERAGYYQGVEAVIDKDLAGERLADVVGADVLLILTDIEKAKLNYGKPNEEDIGAAAFSEAQRYLAEGHFFSWQHWYEGE